MVCLINSVIVLIIIPLTIDLIFALVQMYERPVAHIKRIQILQV